MVQKQKACYDLKMLRKENKELKDLVEQLKTELGKVFSSKLYYNLSINS